MATTPGYLLNTVTANTGSGPMVIKSGALLADPSVQAAVAAAGGGLASAIDPLVIAAALIVIKLRGKGADERFCDSVMQAASSVSGSSLKFTNTVIAVNASGTVPLTPEPAPRAGSLVGGTVMFEGVAAAGESASLQFRQNGVNIAGAVVAAGATAKKALAVPNLPGLAYAVGDVFDYVVTYVPGGTPAMTGINADHAVMLQGTP